MFSSTVVITFLQRAVMQGVPLLYGSTGEILTEKSGNLNLGIPGIMYIGGISGVIGAFLYENSLTNKADANAFLSIFIPILCTIIGSLLAGLIYCFLTVTLRANQNVTGLALTTFGVGFGNFFGGSLIKLTKERGPLGCINNNKFLLHKEASLCSNNGLVRKNFPILWFPCILCNNRRPCLRIFLKENPRRTSPSCSRRKPCNSGRCRN